MCVPRAAYDRDANDLPTAHGPRRHISPAMALSSDRKEAEVIPVVYYGAWILWSFDRADRR